MRTLRLPIFLLLLSGCLLAAAQPRTYLLDGWRFCFGSATDVRYDFGFGTEYFNYLTKCNSIHNEGPYSPKFTEEKGDSATAAHHNWQTVSVPHDWVPSLPFEQGASHSHGYHTVGWKYPKTSVGWYRRSFTVDSLMLQGPTRIVFDGIFRDARVWVNGFYLGREESGYLRQTYDITDFLNPGADNFVCVRVDASLEEGWFYEGAGIYRKVWLETGEAAAPRTAPETARYSWSKDEGFLVDGKKVELLGVDLHQDHAGVGVAVPKGLIEYRLRKLKEMGVNAIRCSHNPASEDFLDLCDSLGMYVIEEVRLMGSNRDQRHALEEMICRDMHHKCIILWSIGNEEWGIEWTDKGEKIARRMTSWVHEIDPSRPSTVATSSGPNIIRGVDVAGYNYVMQNDVEGERERFPERIAYGSEETTGCGTRGVYRLSQKEDLDKGNGRMGSMNYPVGLVPSALHGRDGSEMFEMSSQIERGWKFYFERPWLAGLFYWTGFDYMGEPNPLSFPAVGSEFGILDACGFPKDEAFYLKACWTDQPVLHILPHWNLEGHEGDSLDVWVYSNMDAVELVVNGRSLGKKTMPLNGHLSWRIIYKPGNVKAVGYKGGKRTLVETVHTAGPACQVKKDVSVLDDITVIDLTLLDKKGHFAATACDTLRVSFPEGTEVLGCGNGDPACHITAGCWLGKTAFDFPAFNGHAQIILRGHVPTSEITVK